MKYSWKNYWKPTPKLIRKFADSIFVGAMTLSTTMYFNNNEKVAFNIMIIASIMKVISNFFSVDNDTTPPAQ